MTFRVTKGNGNCRCEHHNKLPFATAVLALSGLGTFGALDDKRHLVSESASLATLQLSMLTCSLLVPIPWAPFLRTLAEQSPEGLPLCYRLLEFHERIDIATQCHMRSGLWAGCSM